MQKLIITIFTWLFISPFALSQISGRVVDSQTGAGLAGTTILSNTGPASISNSEGYFTITGSKEDTICVRFTFVGYKSDSLDLYGEKLILLVRLEPELQTIQELIITVSGLPESFFRSTGSAGTLSKENIRHHGGIVLNDAINQIPGVYMSGGGYNTNRLTIRGIGSRSPYSSNRIRAYLNDIPLTSGDGTTSIEDIDIAAISRVEVLKGPSSAVYGSGLGGAVRMWTSQPEEDDFSINLNPEAGSFGTLRSFITAGYKYKRGTVSLVYSNSHSEGYRQNSRYTRNSLIFTTSQNFTKTGVKFTLLYTGVDAQIPSSVNLSSFNTDSRLAAPNWLAIKGFEQYKKLLLGVTLETQVKQGIANKISVFGSFSDPYESRPFNILDENSRSGGIHEHIHVSAGKFEFVAGGEAFLEGFNWKIFETSMGVQGDLLADNHEKRFYLNTFALARHNPGKRFTAELGLNMNILNYSLEDFFREDSLDLSGKYSYAPVLSPRLGINYRLNQEMNLHASLGHGFSAPSLEETLLPDGQINTALKPETGWNFDVGIRGKSLKSKVNYDITLYHIALSNLLVTRRISEEIFSGINAGKTRHTGLESMIKINLLSPELRDQTELILTSSLTASINRFKDFSDNNIDYSGNELPGIPSTFLNHTLRYKFIKNLEITAFHKFTGKQLLNDSNTVEYSNWQLTDLRLDYSIQIGSKQHDFRIYGGVKNLFDKKYSGMILVNAPSFGGTEPRYYYPGLPRNYFFGISLDFN